jgi:hypothetical protein
MREHMPENLYYACIRNRGMDFSRIMFGMFVVLLFAGISFAGCASEAYAKSCSSCTFDQYGKMDQSCSSGYKNSGTGCVSKSYPIMAGKYAMGQCQEVNACASQLSSCSAQYSSGNDKADCQEGSQAVCYAAADECVKRAAVSCGEVEKQCGAPAFALLSVLAGALFISRK